MFLTRFVAPFLAVALAACAFDLPDPLLGGAGGAGGAAGGAGGSGGGGGAAWWDGAFGRRLRVELLGGGAGVPIPVALTLTSPAVDLSAFASGGADVRVVAADDATELPFEIEAWGTQAVLWVLVPAGAPRIFVYHGNPTATPASDPAAVWLDHVGVFHLAGTLADSSPGNHGSPQVVATQAGIAGDGLRVMNQTQEALPATPDFEVAPGEQLTIEVFHARGAPSSSGSLLGTSACCQGYRLDVASGGTVQATAKFGAADCCASPPGDEGASFAPLLTDPVGWHAYALVVDRVADELILFVDGVASAPVPIPTGDFTSGPLVLGQLDVSPAAGVLDEVRLLRRAVPTAEVAARAIAARGAAVGAITLELAP